MQSRYACTLKMGYCSLSCGCIDIKLNIILKEHSTLFLISLYILHTSEVGGMPSERTRIHFRAWILTNSFTDANTMVMYL
jgi:hypothetical protein